MKISVALFVAATICAVSIAQNPSAGSFKTAPPHSGANPTHSPIGGGFKRQKKQYTDCHADKTKIDPKSRGCESIFRGIKTMLTPPGVKPVSPSGAPSQDDKTACDTFLNKKLNDVFSPPIDISTVCCDQVCFCKEAADPSNVPCGGYYERPKNDRPKPKGNNGGKGGSQKGATPQASANAQATPQSATPQGGASNTPGGNAQGVSASPSGSVQPTPSGSGTLPPGTPNTPN